jgi:hypothetical protein
MTASANAPTFASGPSKPRGNITLSRGETGDDYARIDAMTTLANISGIEIDGLLFRAGKLEQKRWPVWMKNVTEAAVSDIRAKGRGLSELLISSDRPVALIASGEQLPPTRDEEGAP